MITRDEMVKFSKMIDDEYKNTILPIYKNSQGAIDTVLSLIRSDNYNVMRKRCGFSHLRFSNLPLEIQETIKHFGYYSVNYNDYQIDHHSLSTSIISYLGYSIVAYGSNAGIWDIMSRADKYLGHDDEKVAFLTSTKKRFNAIKDAYHKFFVKDDGKMFREFGNIILEQYNTIADCDKKKDKDFYALFDGDVEKSSVKITITIKGV